MNILPGGERVNRLWNVHQRSTVEQQPVPPIGTRESVDEPPVRLGAASGSLHTLDIVESASLSVVTEGTSLLPEDGQGAGVPGGGAGGHSATLGSGHALVFLIMVMASQVTCFNTYQITPFK